MMNIYNNPFNLSKALMVLRIKQLDPQAEIFYYTDLDNVGVVYPLATGTANSQPIGITTALPPDTIQSVLNAAPTQQEQDTLSSLYGAFGGIRNLPNWSTFTPQQASDFVNASIFNGQTQAQIDTFLNNTLTGTTVAALRTQVISVFSQTAGAILSVRAILQDIAKVLVHIRNILLNR